MNVLESGAVRTNSDPDELIIRILKIYEERYFVFQALNLSGIGILNKMNTLLYPVLNIKMQHLFRNDFNSFIMIVAAFFGKHIALVASKNGNTYDWDRTEEKNLLSECQHPLHTLMVMCYAAHSMRQILLKDDFGQDLKNESYKELKARLEELACDLINHMYHMDVKMLKAVLEVDYQSEFSQPDSVTPDTYVGYLKTRFDQSKEIMAIAYEAKAMKFLSQRPCRNLMRIREECRKPHTDCEKHTMSRAQLHRIVEPKKHNKVKMRYKLALHGIFRAVYVLMFAIMLCRSPNYDDYDAKKLVGVISFIYVLSVLLAQLLMTSIKTFDYVIFHSNFGIQPKIKKPTYKEWLRSYLRLIHEYYAENKVLLSRMVMTMTLIFLEAFRLIFFLVKGKKGVKNADLWYSGWTTVPIALELLYCTLFAIAAVSSLRLLHSFSALGFFVHLMKKMLKTVGMFVLIFSMFWFVLAVIHVSISRTLPSSDGTLLYTVVSEGKFEIFGEVRDEDRVGVLTDCGHFNRTVLDFLDMHYDEASCLVRSSIIPFIVFVYMFVAGVLLVNLLTAQLTKEYEEESENSRFYVGYLQYEQLSKIESKLFLPPPLSLIYVLVRFLYCCDCAVRIMLVALFSADQQSSTTLVPATKSRASMFVGWARNIEGTTWGAVREDAESSQGAEDAESSQGPEEVAKEFVRKGPECACDLLKDIINKYTTEIESKDSLKRLKKELNDFLEAITEERGEMDRTQAGSRGPSALDSRQGNQRNELTSALSTTYPFDDAKEETSL